MEELEKLGLRENTIVIFTSDNGGIRAISTQHPLRAGKGSYYEGGIRVPLIIRWPGIIEEGSKSHEPVINLDIYPTILEILNLPHRNLDGRSMLPVLEGKSSPQDRSLFWHFPCYLQGVPKGYQRDSHDGRWRTS